MTKSVIVNKDVFTDEWSVGHVKISPIEVIDLGDTKEVFYEDFIMEEDRTFTIHTQDGVQTVTINAGVYEPPFL